MLANAPYGAGRRRGCCRSVKRGAGHTPLLLHIAVRSLPTTPRPEASAPAACGAPPIERPCGDIGNTSKGDGGSQADDQGIGNRPSGGSWKRRRNATAGMSDQLQIRLHDPPRRNVRLIAHFEHRFVVAHGTFDTSE